jgi:hypothetical protein
VRGDLLVKLDRPTEAQLEFERGGTHRQRVARIRATERAAGELAGELGAEASG